MKKSFKILLLVLIILPCVFMLTGCFNQSAYVTNIVKSAEYENYSVYTITYSDGKTSTFTVKNGTDGADGKGVTIEEVYEAYLKQNEEEALDFNSFLEKYLSLTVEDTSGKEAVNKALMSAVSVFTRYGNSNNIYCGAGVIYKMEEDFSYIITNYHVVYNSENLTQKVADNIYIYQYGHDEQFAVSGNTIVLQGDAVKCTYIGGSVTNDLAVLKCKTGDLIKYNADARAVDSAERYSVADSAFAIGNPEGDGLSVTKGIISVDSELVEMNAVDNSSVITLRVMRIDTAVNGGNSGGGLFNEKGELIGIVNAKKIYTSNNTPIDNMAYALPMDIVTKLADNILFYHKSTLPISNSPVQVKKLILGVNLKQENAHTVLNGANIELEEDVIIQKVENNSFASSIGLQVNDVIKSVEINGQVYKISRLFQLKDLMYVVRNTDGIVFNVVRAGQNVKTELTYVTNLNLYAVA